MGVYDYNSLLAHVGHKIVCTTYGKKGEPPVNVAIECETCYEVLLDYDNENFTEQMESLKGQFLQGKPQKLKKPQKGNLASYSNNLSNGTFKPNGRVAPKKGAI